MKAVFLPGNKRVEIRAVEVPKPRQDEVLVQVKASCICRSDLSLYYGNAVVGGDAAGRCITGHEPAGIIVEVGSAVRQFKKDDRVAIHLAIGCGVCAYCAPVISISAPNGPAWASPPMAAMPSILRFRNATFYGFPTACPMWQARSRRMPSERCAALPASWA
jgi:threonine dehydrogenase-like Zn-dependent dehydrogenase